MSPAKKPKLVRDSFTIPKAEYAAIDLLKERAMAMGRATKKSELLRAGLKVLAGMGDDALRAALAGVPTLKTGRPAAEPATTPAPVPKVPAARKASPAVPAKSAALRPVPARKAAVVKPAPTRKTASRRQAVRAVR